MPKRNRVTTISIDKELKELLVRTIESKPLIYNRINSWDDLIKYVIRILKQKDI